MTASRFTAAAERALRSAEEWAIAEGHPLADAAHLLSALAEEESRAAAIVVQSGIPLEQLIELARRLRLDSPPDNQASPLRLSGRSALLDEIVDAAGHKAGLSDRHAETGTEHLLWGLVSVPSPVSSQLMALGLVPHVIAGQFGAADEFENVPIPTNLQLRTDDTAERDLLRVHRIIDAAANRAREGLRTVEDHTRFVLDDAHLTERLKQARHRLTAVLGRFDNAVLLTARETSQDVGTTISTAAESSRTHPGDVAAAAFKRTQEALRTLEEFSKSIDGEAASEFEQLRYETYTLEKMVIRTARSRERLDGCTLYLLVSQASCELGLETVIREAVSGGAAVIQLREKQLADRELVALGRRVRELTRRYPALYIMNDRPDLAVLTEADGVHVGQTELSVGDVRRIVGPHQLIGVSTHDIGQARQAVADGADYLGVGPMFPSRTKSFDTFAGLEFAREVAAEITLPWFAIGGITPDNVADVAAAGAERIAVGNCVCADENPQRIAADLRGRLVQVD